MGRHSPLDTIDVQVQVVVSGVLVSDYFIKRNVYRTKYIKGVNCLVLSDDNLGTERRLESHFFVERLITATERLGSRRIY